MTIIMQYRYSLSGDRKIKIYPPFTHLTISHYEISLSKFCIFSLNHIYEMFNYIENMGIKIEVTWNLLENKWNPLSIMDHVKLQETTSFNVLKDNLEPYLYNFFKIDFNKNEAFFIIFIIIQEDFTKIISYIVIEYNSNHKPTIGTTQLEII